MRNKLSVLFLSACTVLLIAGLLAYPAWRFSKQWRAQNLHSQAIAHAAQSQLYEAYQKALAAHLFAPDSPVYRRTLARHATQLGRSDAFALWQPLLADDTLPSAEDLLSLTQHLQARGAHDQALQVANRLLLQHPDNAAGRIALLEILQRFGLHRQIIEHTQQWMDAGADSEAIFFAHVDALFQVTDLAAQARALDFLSELSQRDDAVGLRALRTLLARNVSAQQLPALINRLDTHPLAALDDRFFVLEWQHANDSAYADKALHDGIRNLHTALQIPLATSLPYLQWLQRNDQFDTILSLLDFASVRTDPQVLRIYLNALIDGGQPEQALHTLLTYSADLPISETAHLIFRARAFEASAQPDRAAEAIELAIATIELSEFDELEGELSRLRQWDRLSDLYMRLAESRATRDFTAAKLLTASYFLNNEADLFDALQQLDVEDFQNNPSFHPFVLYLKLLYNTPDKIAALHALESMVLRFPERYEPRVLIAFAHSVHGSTTVADALLGSLPRKLPEREPAYLRTALHITQALAGSQPPTQEIQAEALLPREFGLLHHSAP